MLLFYRATAQDPNPETLAEEGLSPNGRSSIRLWQKLEDVPARAGPTLVVDTRALPENERSDDVRSLRVPTVPPDALCNAAPYRSPQSVSAGGGYVGCALPDDVALLLIFRRGVWDLPKGTKESDESIVTCARREVGEEVGVDTITVLRNLGTTRHGYPDEDRYVVKTTHWYLMQTPERFFEPDRQEGIQHVARARWPVARKHLGYASLRRHMDRVKEDVYTVLVP